MTKTLSKAKRAPLYFAIFLDMAGFGMILPDIQTRLETVGARGWLIGSIFAAYFLVQMVASPVWGRWSDRAGRKPVLILCGSLSAVSMLVYGWGHSVVMILLSRVLAGMGGGNVVAAQARLADMTEGQARTEAMSRVGIATTGGLVLGPALGGWLSTWGDPVLLGTVAASLSFAGVVWICAGIPNSPPPPVIDSQLQAVSPRLALLRDVPALRPLFVLAIAAFFALACLEGTFGRLIRLRFGFGPAVFGLIFGYEALLGLGVQGWLLPRLSRRIVAISLLSIAYGVQSIGLAITPFAPSLAGLFFASTLFATGASLSLPTLNSLCSVATPLERQGEMFGLLQSARSFGFLLGPILGGILFDWKPASPYLLAGAVLLTISVSMSLLLKNRYRS